MRIIVIEILMLLTIINPIFGISRKQNQLLKFRNKKTGKIYGKTEWIFKKRNVETNLDNATQSEFWNKLSQDRSFIPVDYQAIFRTRDIETLRIDFRVEITRSTITVWGSQNVIYKNEGKLANSEMSHGGLHMLVLHPFQGRIMFKKHFKTSQPGESKLLEKALTKVLPGRLIILVAVPFGAYYLDPDAIRTMEYLGSEKISRLAYNESWILITHSTRRVNAVDADNGNRSIFEKSLDRKPRVYLESAVLTTLDRHGVPPVIMATSVPKYPLPTCDWYSLPSRSRQAAFCEKFAIYPEICRCEDPINPKEFRYASKKLNMTEIIPVAMLTAVSPHNFYRQLMNLLKIDGSSQTPIYVFVDGINEEVISIATMFGLEVKVHRPQGEDGSETRLNMHFRFSVHRIFDANPSATKAIILEDDLILSPDFLSYFHQTAWLLETDASLYCVNAFSINSYSTVASDATALRRSGAFPQFGWMVTRNWATTQLPLWVHEQANQTDWDWWLGKDSVKREKFVLVPEVSRTFHAGSAGAHVTGWEQAFYFSNMIYNLDPDIKLANLDKLQLSQYDHSLEAEIKGAELLGEEFNPCAEAPLSEKMGNSFKVSVFADSTSYDEQDGFYFVALCLHAHSRDFRDIYKGVQVYSLSDKKLYVVGCPVSPFCNLFVNLTSMNPLEDMVEYAETRDFSWRSRNYQYPYKIEMFTVQFIHLFNTGLILFMVMFNYKSCIAIPYCI